MFKLIAVDSGTVSKFQSFLGQIDALFKILRRYDTTTWKFLEFDTSNVNICPVVSKLWSSKENPSPINIWKM
jgi:hypothetical protein